MTISELAFLAIGVLLGVALCALDEWVRERRAARQEARRQEERRLVLMAEREAHKADTRRVHQIDTELRPLTAAVLRHSRRAA